MNWDMVCRNTWLGNTAIIFFIQQICWNQGQVDLTVHNTAMLIKFSTQISQQFCENN